MATVSDGDWRKSSFCSANSCVEVLPLVAGSVAVQDSKHPDDPPLVFGAGEWAAFVAGVKAGEFDDTLEAE